MEENKDTNIKATIDAVTGLVQAIPVYQDTLQPAAKQFGQSLETVAKTVNIALAPIKALVWGYEKIEEFIATRVSEKLKNVPEENITTPPPQVAGPAIEALRFSGNDHNLRELYANLIATSMDKATISQAHPGFVEIIKNLSSDEALLLKAFISKNEYPLIDIIGKSDGVSDYILFYPNYSNFQNYLGLKETDSTPSYIDNLTRLGLLAIPSNLNIALPNIYEKLEKDFRLDGIKTHIEKELNRKVGFNRKLVMTSTFGKLFIQNVVKEKI